MLPYIRRDGDGIYVKETGISASEKRRNGTLIIVIVHVDKRPHVWDKGRDSDVLEVLGKNALFYKQIAIAVTTVPNKWFLFT